MVIHANIPKNYRAKNQHSLAQIGNRNIVKDENKIRFHSKS